MRISMAALQACDADPFGDQSGCGVSPGGGGSGIPDWITIDNSPTGPGDFSTPYDYAMYMGLDVPAETRSTFGTSSFPKSPPQGSGISVSDWAKLVQVSSQALISGVKQTQSPYLIPGTNLVYNPATGQLGSGPGTTASQVSSSVLPIVIVAGLLAFVFMGRKG